VKKPSKTLDDFKTQHDPATIISRLNAELAKATEQLGLENAVKDLLGTAALRLEDIKAPAWTYAPVDNGAPGVPTLLLSDLHWGERVSRAELGGVNEFNLEIAHRRMKYTVETAIHLLKILDNKMRYPGIVVPLGGDMISGNIHEELMATNELQTMPTVLDLYEELCGAIGMLADVFGSVFLPCVSGNHGRDTHKIWSKNRNHTSFDWLLYQFLARKFAGDKRITFYVPRGSDALYRVHHIRYLLTHGDQFRGGDSIIGALGPLTRGNQKKQARNQAIGQEFDIMLCGHWHQYIHTERLIVNGSMKGYDEYAAQGNFSYEPPRQALWMTHPKYGLTYRMPVLCDKPEKRLTTDWVSIPK
jgi:hypothetical protein